MDSGILVNLPVIDYGQAWALQKRIVSAKINARFRDTFLILEHSPVFTLGRMGNPENLLVDENTLGEKGIGLYHVERGGDITYHGPGQIIGYPILYFKKYGYRHRAYIYELEEVLIRVLKDLGIVGMRHPELRGVWVDDLKIGSVGVAVRKWVSFHGFSINIDPDFDHLQLINPCGIGPDKVTSVRRLTGNAPDSLVVRHAIACHFQNIFGLDLEEVSLKELELMIKGVHHLTVNGQAPEGQRLFREGSEVI